MGLDLDLVRGVEGRVVLGREVTAESLPGKDRVAGRVVVVGRRRMRRAAPEQLTAAGEAIVWYFFPYQTSNCIGQKVAVRMARMGFLW